MAELNNSSTGQWSETDANNISASPDGWPNGTFFNQVEPIGRSTMGAIKRFWDRINGTISSTGSTNAYVYTPANLSYPTAIVTGEEYSFKANFTNTGVSTLNINGLGAQPLFKQGSTGPVALTGGEIQSGQIVKVQYDGVSYQILSSISSPLSNLGSNLAVVSNALVAMPNAKRSTGLIVTSSTTFSTIPGFSWVLGIGLYAIQVYLRIDQGVTGGHKTQSAFTGGTSDYYQHTYWTRNAAALSDIASNTTGTIGAIDSNNTGTLNSLVVNAYLSVTAQGMFVLQGSQNVSNATSTIFNGYAIITQLS